jgi:uncharacterized protein (DUF305 family)
MTRSQFRAAAALMVAVALGACASAGRPAAQTAPQPVTQSASQSAPLTSGDIAARAKASRDSARYPYTEADIHFMSGMIAHHAQAIKMARLAPTNDASPSVRTLCDRIINAQTDEIRLMQMWLRDRRQPVPEPNPAGMAMMMNGMQHTMLMPGMLTEEQMKDLAAAKGGEFDRLFLTGMIQHHRGAIAMVDELLGSYGAAQDELVAKFSQDVQADQGTEIVRMQQMLATVIMQGHAP